MAKPKYANLIFKSGEILAVPLKQETFPPSISHKFYEKYGNPAKIGGEMGVTIKTIEFYYVGCQHGVGAYVERDSQVLDGGHRSMGVV